MATPRSTRNNASGTLGAGYTAGDGHFTLTAGHGTRFAGTKWPIYVTAVENPGPGETVKGVFSVTGVSTDTLQGVLAADGTTDTNVANGATIECRPTRQHIDDLIDACTGSLATTGGTASGIAVTSSTVDSTPVGGTTPAAGTFTTVTSTGNASFGGPLTVTAAGGATVNLTSTLTNVVFNCSAYTFQVTSSSGIYLNGNVGIGVGTPLRALHVSGAGSSSPVEILVADTDQAANSRVWAIGNASSNLVIKASQDNPSFSTTIVTITRSGNSTFSGRVTAGSLAFSSAPASYASDAAAAAGGVPVGGLYHTSGSVKIRLT